MRRTYTTRGPQTCTSCRSREGGSGVWRPVAIQTIPDQLGHAAAKTEFLASASFFGE